MKRFVIYFIGWFEDYKPFIIPALPVLIAFSLAALRILINDKLDTIFSRGAIDKFFITCFFLFLGIEGIVIITRKELPVLLFIIKGKFALLVGLIILFGSLWFIFRVWAATP